MLRFTVSNQFPKKRISDFHIYVGDPNPKFNASEFQATWLRKYRNFILNDQFRNWLEDIRRIAQKEHTSFATVCKQAAIQSHHQQSINKPGQSDQKVIDLARLIETKKDRVEITEGHVDANPLLPLWTCDLQNEISSNETRRRSKAKVISRIIEIIISRASIPFNSKVLLTFLLNYEQMSLASLLRVKIDSQSVDNIMYLLAVIGDTESSTFSEEALSDFLKFLSLPRGKQLTAIIDLRDCIEQWTMYRNPKFEAYDLTEFHNDLLQYFRPQQWKTMKTPTAKQMFALSTGLRTGKAGVKSLLGEISWASKAAFAGDKDAQYAMSYYFAQCQDSLGHKYWLKRAAKLGSAKAFFALGIACLRGKNGLSRKCKAAIRYFTKADRAGQQYAKGQIGHCHLRLRNFNQALLWLNRAVTDDDDEYALYNLGRMYEKGWGVPKSNAASLGYYISAGDLGHEIAQRAALRLRGRLISFEPQIK